MSSPTIGVLALQGDFREHLTSFAELGVDTVAVRRVSELAKCDGLVVPGGESTTMIKLAANFNLLAPLRTKIAAGMPAFGTCAGMIMLADRITDGIAGQETLGGLDITVRRNAFGRQTESFETDLLLAADPDPFHAVFIRAPWVEQVGSQVAVLATAAIGDGGNKIVAVQQEQILATAFHPEVTGDLRIHQLFLDLVKQA